MGLVVKSQSELNKNKSTSFIYVQSIVWIKTYSQHYYFWYQISYLYIKMYDL